MKLVYRCAYCQINIFDAAQDVCCNTPVRKHTWRIQEIPEEEEKNKINYLKEVIYV